MDNLKLVYNLSPFYKSRLETLIQEQNLSSTQALEFLLDYYYLDNSSILTLFFKQLSKRLYQGVDRSFIIQIRLIYTAIGHFLKKLRYV